MLGTAVFKFWLVGLFQVHSPSVEDAHSTGADDAIKYPMPIGFQLPQL